MVTTHLIILWQGAPHDHREGAAPVEGVGVGNVLVEGAGGSCPVLSTKTCIFPGIEGVCQDAVVAQWDGAPEISYNTQFYQFQHHGAIWILICSSFL